MVSDKSSRSGVWRIRRGLDRRFRSGHPWVYSNELISSPKGITPGACIELQDAGGKFLARGYGNPHSLIAFRALTRDPQNLDPLSASHLVNALVSAGRIRAAVGLEPYSHRLCFGEADFLPGLVIDRYRVESGQVFAVQAHTAGANQWIPIIEEVLEGYCRQMNSPISWSKTAIVLRNDLAVRKLEGLSEEKPQVLRDIPGLSWDEMQIQVAPVFGGVPLYFKVDLLKGQKTGFFLDQFANIQAAALRFKNISAKTIRIIDLCCYVGQWGAQLGRVFREMNQKVEVLAVDASQAALDFAKMNVEAVGVPCKTLKADVLKDLEKLGSNEFDLVISDPPAFIKTRKDIPTGKHAYLQLATQATRLLKKGGGIVSCSCSALLEEEVFSEVLAKGASRNQTQIRWVGRGAPSPDHPMLQEFPEGRYLKSWIGLSNN